tara:strand:- start:481 stop:753 length:273 start_codon:yes stop_codon:yes gene_type:complete
MITPEMIETWRTNYGLDKRSPAEAARWWSDKYDGLAPAGAVAAFGYLLEARDAKPEWQGLTFADIDDLGVSKDWIAGARWAETKLKEKNT